jgi:hypothetical protein
MNETSGIFFISAICDICQISHGFSPADRRAIIVLVVLTGIALVLCYAGVLWYSIRTRYIPDKLPIIVENVYANQAFDYSDIQNEDIEENVKNTGNVTPTQTVVFTVENEKERY